MKNDQLIPASAFVVMSTGVLASVQKNSSLPGVNFWIGIALAYVVIALIAELNSDIGSGVAILVMVSAVMGNGEDLTAYINSKMGSKPVQPNVTRRRGPQITIGPRPRNV